MAHRPRSLRHEYELYVDLEIENYKESVPRRVILAIGDEAVKGLGESPQLALTEILLCAEVDRIIRARLRVPSYDAWRKRRVKALADFQRPERWGMRPDSALVRTVNQKAGGEHHVLVAGANEEGPALYLAANGCEVTALDREEEVLARVFAAAAEVGLSGRIRGLVADLASWSPDMPLSAVVCAAAAFAGLSDMERRRAIALLQRATTDGGVHLVETSAHGVRLVAIEELRSVYRGWQVTVERGGTSTETFLATKHVA
jgi:hypothetical protein